MAAYNSLEETLVALGTRPGWVADLKRALAKPYTADELRRMRDAISRIDTMNSGRHWPDGTLQQLLDRARQEDEEDDQPRHRL